MTERESLLCSWTDHSLRVTDIACGAGGLRARVASVSLDHTFKVRSIFVVAFRGSLRDV